VVAVTKDDIWKTLLMVRQAYQDSLDGKSISFTGVNGRAITNHDPKALRDELNTGSVAGAQSTAVVVRTNSLTFCKAFYGHS
jgi:hypothetical protein